MSILIYNIKPSDGKAPVSGALGNMEYLFIAIAPRSTLALKKNSVKK